MIENAHDSEMVNRFAKTHMFVITDIYSRVDSALAGLFAQHLKSCDSVDYRLTAVKEQRPPASETRAKAA
jgi:hypothetical protein